MNYKIRGSKVAIQTEELQGGRRLYHHQSTSPQREPYPSQRSYAEQTTRLRSGQLLHDAIFALTWHELAEAAVETIQDAAFHSGKSLACHGFETGEAWRYVWTRDIAYSVALGLGWFDPERARQSLLFKLSKPRSSCLASAEEIVQDTGSGGSWPVSSDRVVWAFACEKLLPFLPEETRTAWISQSLAALVQTLETDRRVVFDATDGLYRGEQSFLDWREQTYASWTRDDVLAISRSKALSTNILHLMALRVTARLATMQGQDGSRYQKWADRLSHAIQKTFWDEKRGLFRSLTSASGFSLEKYDLLGQALAVLAGVATAGQAQLIWSRYPLTEAGPPVIHPQQADVAIYHNRAIWPFVTVFAMQAAAQAQHAPFVSAAFASLLDGAALHLSHMENYEFLSGQPFFADGSLSGPVINSRRQLWSVAGMAHAWIELLFGLQPKMDRFCFAPRLTLAMARRYWPEACISLYDLCFHGKRLQLSLRWPKELRQDGDAFFELQELYHRGQRLSAAEILYDELQDGDEITICLRRPKEQKKLHLDQITAKPAQDRTDPCYRRIFAPIEPKLHWQGDGVLAISSLEDHSSWDLYADGRLVQSHIQQDTVSLQSGAEWQAWITYEAVQRFLDTGLVSHPSRPLDRPGWIRKIPVKDWQSLPANDPSHDDTVSYFADWGEPQQVLLLKNLRLPISGFYQLELLYSNAHGPISTGVTAAVKTLHVREYPEQGRPRSMVHYFCMPHTPSWEDWRLSSPVLLHLHHDCHYELELCDAKNMSYLQHFSAYQGVGGETGAMNRIRLQELQLKLRSV